MIFYFSDCFSVKSRNISNPSYRSFGNNLHPQHFIQSFSPSEITPEQVLKNCIFNNVNMFDGRTFETHADQGDKKNRKWVTLRNLSDEICKNHGLSIIENPEKNKGKSHYEWDMNRQNLSWKAKLKFAIDQFVKESEDFEDFLRKCRLHNIEVVYNPEHVIDLKFRLDGQKKFARARPLGWYYESKQIARRIAIYKGVMTYTPNTNIIRTDTEKIVKHML